MNEKQRFLEVLIENELIKLVYYNGQEIQGEQRQKNIQQFKDNLPQYLKEELEKLSENFVEQFLEKTIRKIKELNSQKDSKGYDRE